MKPSTHLHPCCYRRHMFRFLTLFHFRKDLNMFCKRICSEVIWVSSNLAFLENWRQGCIVFKTLLRTSYNHKLRLLKFGHFRSNNQEIWLRLDFRLKRESLKIEMLQENLKCNELKNWESFSCKNWFELTRRESASESLLRSQRKSR